MVSRSTPDQSRRRFLRNAMGAAFGAAGFPSSGLALAAITTNAVGAADRSSTAEFSDILATVDLSIRHIASAGLDNIFPRPFEADYLEQDPALRNEVRLAVAEWLTAPRYIRTPIRPAHCMPLPKWWRDAYRPCALVDPLDSIRYLAVAILIAGAVETHRRPAAARRVFSCRFDPHELDLFDWGLSLSSFRNETENRIKAAGEIFLVHADVANFYSSIDIGKLCETLTRHGVEDRVIAAADSILRAWAGTSGRGIPTGPSASHILAEAFMLDVDNDLIEMGVDYVRFADDYRLLASNEATARHWLDALSECLGAKGLTLNSGKTSIDWIRSVDYASPPDRPTSTKAETGTAIAQDEEDKKRKSRRPTKPMSSSPTRRSSVEHEWFARIDRTSLFARLEKADYVHVEEFRQLIESCLRHQDYDLLKDSLTLSERSPHCIPYFVEFLIQEAAGLPGDLRTFVSHAFGRLLRRREALPEYAVLFLAKLLTSDAYANPRPLYDYLQRSWETRSPILVRFLLETLDAHLTQSEALALCRGCTRDDPWIIRAILRVATRHLDQGDQAALFARYGRDADKDPFLRVLVEKGGQPARLG
jgi:hypothetical protein